jgi:quercetin dioxygenase-like cupin family protein/DNA-binding XRE family transcriptional regulator
VSKEPIVVRDVAELDESEWATVGTSIRDRRHKRRLTMVELAQLCALSQPFLSQVENGRAKPSMDSLYRIARALDTTPQALFGMPSASTTTPTLVRGGDAIGVSVHDDASDASSGSTSTSTVRLLLPGDTPFHVLEFVGLPTEFLDYWEHDGFESIYVLAGEVEVDIDGTSSTVRQGDFMSYPAQLPHRHRSTCGPDARVLMIETKVDSVQQNHSSGHHPDLRHHTSILKRHHDVSNQ